MPLKWKLVAGEKKDLKLDNGMDLCCEYHHQRLSCLFITLSHAFSFGTSQGHVGDEAETRDERLR